MKRRLSLDYTIGDLAIAPYLDGLRNGKAIAQQCGNCQRVTFPPQRSCTCEPRSASAPASRWLQLPGTAQLTFRTDGPEGSYALAQFDGADNRAVCRIENGECKESTAALQADQRDIPGIVVKIVGDVIERTG